MSPKNSEKEICFGWNRETDEQSLKQFLQKFCREEFLDQIVSRLSDQEIINIIDHLTGLMRTHLSEKEYHRLFISTQKHDPPSNSP